MKMHQRVYYGPEEVFKSMVGGQFGKLGGILASASSDAVIDGIDAAVAVW